MTVFETKYSANKFWLDVLSKIESGAGNSNKVLILGSPAAADWNNDVQSKILGEEVFTDVDIIRGDLVTPTLGTLQQYCAVLVYSDTGFADANVMGDNLASYVDGGGGVVICVFANVTGVNLGGRWASESYNPIVVNVQASGTPLTLGDVPIPDHYVMRGVSSFSGGSTSFNNPGNANSGTATIAKWSNNKLLVVEKVDTDGKIICLNFYPPSSTVGGPSFWDATTDGGLLMSNALYYVAVPSVNTDSLDMLFSANANVGGTFVLNGSSAVKEYGFVWSTTNPPTVDDNKVMVGTTIGIGESYSTGISGLPFPATIYVAAYAINDTGVGYGVVLSGEVQICFAAGTKISTPYGDKNIEEITYEDDLVVWNFDEGKLDIAKPVWMVRPFKSSSYALLKFTDGTELRTVADGRGHRIFNINSNMFTYSTTEDTPLGTQTFTKDEKTVELTEVKVIKEETTFYNIVTKGHFNMFANNILTSTGLNNLYPIHNMKFVKEGRSMISREAWSGIPDVLYEGLRLGEQPLSVYDKICRMVKRQY